ncbi:hypothetical protein SAMN06265171_1204 [Chryseobacterium rhizoplanae]|uniref:Uncharacterized protein n=1 Tax=Chryseobacterium rhizoplanae TaxID=1609531 RepID=A0A521FNT1_9FLAO|nr:hypothetical protein [Chryseobacterium rhizoplanae]SMO97121.1 hypothetical protein SAMN06265171_1204 [Chryseobacterium rhizoplanae]
MLTIYIVEYSAVTNDQTIEIYKLPWTVESVYGNDIDLFIQNGEGSYNWYALQAKVMSYNGAFKDLKYNRNEAFQQWDKLLRHESVYGSKTFYLLYSGNSLRAPYVQPTRRDCIGIPLISELGLGIVETRIVADIRTNVLRHSQMLYFEQVFPDHLDSIRKLFCCSPHLPPKGKTFKREEIETFGYRQVYADSKEFDEDRDSQRYEIPDGAAAIRMIINYK